MMRVLLEVETPTSTTVNVSNQTLTLIYQKLKTNKQVKQEKHHKRQTFKRLFLFDFIDTNTNFKTL
jgi:CRISPR/Cas system endoribonuclease Cas6 (RAMP superfamily)